MAERRTSTGWIAVASLACLGLAAWLQFGESTPKRSRPALFDHGYVARVSELIDAGRPAEAQAELDRSTLLNREALELIKRMPRVEALKTDIESDAVLRKRLAQVWADQLGTDEHLDNAQRDALELATKNAEALILLDPSDARAWAVAGNVYLRRGFESNAPIEYMKAANYLKRALTLDPDLPGARNALRVATRRSGRN